MVGASVADHWPVITERDDLFESVDFAAQGGGFGLGLKKPVVLDAEGGEAVFQVGFEPEPQTLRLVVRR